MKPALWQLHCQSLENLEGHSRTKFYAYHEDALLQSCVQALQVQQGSIFDQSESKAALPLSN